MLLTMCVSIYTSRVVLQNLGIEDFGIYNVVGGVVALLNFFTNTMSSSFLRFFCFEVNADDKNKFTEVIGTSLSVIGLWSIIVIVFAETAGLWLINNKLIIPEQKIYDANIVYQFSIAIFIIGLFQSVYNALIISFEKMKLFAYISIIESFFKLAVAYTIALFLNNKLLHYGWLLFIASLLIFLIYILYCFKYFEVCRTFFKYDKSILKKLLGFSSWTLIGSFSNVFQTHGISVLLNLFFGPTINAARGISFQIYTAISTFTRGFQTAFSPTMIKTFDKNMIETVIKQFITSSKVSFYLMFLLSLPFFVNIDLILDLWLGRENVPEYTNQFVLLMIIVGLIESLAAPVINIIYANGKVKWFQITIGLFTLLVVPLAYWILRLGYKPTFVYVVTILVAAGAQAIRLYYLQKYLAFNIRKYCFKIVIPSIMSITILLLISILCSQYLDHTIILSIIVASLLFIFSLVTIYTVCLEKYEQQIIVNLIKKCVQYLR